MDLEHWYRCSVCGYMYTPQQVQALMQLLGLGRVGATPEDAGSGAIPCRKKGCAGHVRPSDLVHRDPGR
jgi:hypothetical protein